MNILRDFAVIEFLYLKATGEVGISKTKKTEGTNRILLIISL